MLKNVAIPLMLAASEAEGQTPPTNRQILDALKADRSKDVPRLQADAAACTVESSQAADGIATAAQKVSEKTTKLSEARAAVTTLQAATTGAWTIANTAREAAVAAAVASEAEAGIAGFLDAVDAKAALERTAAAAYVAADKLYQDGIVAKTNADAAVSTATKELNALTAAKDTSAAAVQAVRTQSTKELLWREWLYCELGGSPAGVTGNWWTFSQDTMIAGTALPGPVDCTVPAVSNAAEAQVRQAVKYYTSKTGTGSLAAEKDDGSERWNATVDLTTATTAETASSTREALDSGMGSSQSRQQVGVVAWATENKRAKLYVTAQRTREKAMYSSVIAAAATATTAVNGWATNATLANLSTANTAYNFGAGCTGSEDACQGAAKWLAAKKTARDAGSDLAVGADRTTATGMGANDWQDTWAISTASVTAWKSSNVAASTKAAAYTWWLSAQAVTVALDAWYVAFAAKPGSIDAAVDTNGALTSTTIEEEEKQGKKVNNTTDISRACDATSGTGWASNSATTEAKCKAACVAVTAGLKKDMDYTAVGASSATVNGKTADFTVASAEYCGAYSFTTTGTVCKILKNSETAAAPTTTSDTADGKCFVMKAASASAYSSKQWYDWQTAVKGAWDTQIAGTNTLHTNMVTAMGAQADLEKAWLAAHYDAAYWVAVVAQIDGASTNNYRTKYFTPNATMDLAVADTTNCKALVCLAKATADSDAAGTLLETAQATLTTLQANTATAQAAVDELGRRIIRANTELAELTTLSDATTPGTLDAAATLRLADYNAFASDGVNPSFTGYAKGIMVLATEAQTAATAAVRAEVPAPTPPATTPVAVTAGTLTAARTLAQGAWDLAKAATVTATSDLNTALSGTVLADLRAKVDSDTADWTTQQGILDGLVAAVAIAEGALETAVADQVDLVLACQVKQYDAYRTTLETAMVKRNSDLVTIKGLIEAELTKPAPGTVGARCEKALSNGTFRPKRGETTCGGEDFCCGAARVWMSAGAGTADAMWRTIETCQKADTPYYNYQPARSPLAITMPAIQDVAFTCIEGAKKLAAAASAVAAAVYMLA